MTAPRGRSLEAGLGVPVQARRRAPGSSVAVVTSAVPLSDAQKQRLGAALAKLYGRKMHLNLDVDPEVLGGIRVQVGDEVINGSLADRLEDASRRWRASSTQSSNRHVFTALVGPCRGSGGRTPDPKKLRAQQGEQGTQMAELTIRPEEIRDALENFVQRTSPTRARATRSVRSPMPATASRKSRACPRPWRTNC